MAVSNSCLDICGALYKAMLAEGLVMITGPLLRVCRCCGPGLTCPLFKDNQPTITLLSQHVYSGCSHLTFSFCCPRTVSSDHISLDIHILTSVITRVSSGCTSALGSIATNPDSEACLSPSSLVSIFIGSSDSSVIDPINNWLNSICTVGSCSNATLAAIVTNITSGCPSELGTLGYDAYQPQALIDIVQDAYPTVRQVLCLKRYVVTPLRKVLEIDSSAY